MRRQARGARFVLLALLVLVPPLVAVLGPSVSPGGGLPTASAGALPAAGAALGVDARFYGSGPMADILYWADQKKACGLTRDQLAAMVIVPTYTETGAGTQYSPSPMTLSRYDTQAGLYAFKDTNTIYSKAFFHPGIGMWQFDSAGGWNLSAGTAINTYTAAQTAATLMAQRWCQNPSRAYAWAPWYYCGTTSICENVYNDIFDGTSLKNLTLDASVSSYGGMVARNCSVYLLGTVSCFYVDPAKAQGLASWNVPGYGPAPISAPFYVFENGGNEYRYWLPNDTGYPFPIVAYKPITANARTALTWVSRNDFCDLNTFHGACDHGPVGSLDGAYGGGGGIVANGWVIDPDTANPVNVHLYVDGVFQKMVTAGGTRNDIAATYPGFGAGHGYSTLVTGLAPGAHQLCAYGINVLAGGNTTLGCKNVTVPTGNPIGAVDQIATGPGKIEVRGWALDPDWLAAIPVHVYVDATPFAITANLTRNDIAASYPAFGAAHGFDAVFSGIGPGAHQVCVYAINQGNGANASLACKTVTMPTGNPFGSFDAAIPGFGTVNVNGWAIDPDTDAPIGVHLYVDGVFRGSSTASQPRTDLVAAYPLYGGAHGFSFAVTPVSGGPHTACLYGINTAAGSNVLVSCRTFEGVGDPGGALDQVTPSPGEVTVRGWAIDPDTPGPVAVHVYVDGTFLGSGTAGQVRDDIGAAFPGYGVGHGYQFAVGPVGGGTHNVCTYAINVGVGTNRLLGCASVVSSGDPFGNLDQAASSGGGTAIDVSGWGIDPDTVDPDTVHVYVDGVGRVITTAPLSRPDVAGRFIGYGDAHGYQATIAGLGPGSHTVCTYGINVAGSGGNTTLGCRNV